MKPAPFSYLRARSASEAVALLAAAGEDARFLAGGQSLVPMMNFRIARPVALVDLNGCRDLSYVALDKNQLRIGAMTRQYAAENHPLVREHCPLLAQALVHAGPATVRNRATVGGALANGYPLAQLPCVALCLDATLVLEGPRGVRRVPAQSFFVSAMVTDVQPGELLREVVFPVRGARERQAFREAGNHAGGAAQAIVCVALGEELRIAASGLEPVPVRINAAFRADPASYVRSVVRALLDEALEACK
jgi:CO/xanthine dehydrogenase FAD-binding subunit